MTDSMNTISTSAEMVEDAAIPKTAEVHTGPVQTPLSLPPALQQGTERKSPAQWAYERVINYIRNFEEQLDSDHEVGMGLVGNDARTITIEGIGYFDPDIITFYGKMPDGSRTQMIQHVSQLNVVLVAASKQVPDAAPNRIGFRLSQALEPDADAAT